MIGTTAGRVLVQHGEHDWLLRPGESLTIGRGEQCTVRLTDPDIAPNACLLRVVPDMVLVMNQSGRKPFVLRPLHGEDHTVAPRAATTSQPHRVFEVVFTGRDGAPVRVLVDARGLCPPTDTVPAGQLGVRLPTGLLRASPDRG